MSSAGDVNGDGFDDILIGAPWADPVGNKSGTAYVVFGKASGFAPTLSLANLDGNNGFEIRSEAAGDETGWSVSSAGDVNGDGFDDLLVGAIGASLNGSPAGASYVVFGKASGIGALFMLSQLDGTNGFQINSAALGDQTGVSVSSAGDVNSDGFADVIVGARSADPHGGSSGSSYVVFGKASGFGATLELSGLDGTNGFRINGEATKDYSGWSVSSAGDVNGDGFDDVIVGAYGADPNGALSGASYVVFGKASGFAATLDLSSLDGMNGFKINGAAADDRSGYSVSAAGDMNGDGFDDLLVAAPYADPYGALSGTTYVIFGSMPGEAVTRTGTDIANTIHGGDFRDTLAGLKGDDTLYGHRRSDDLNGGRGNDTLIGGMSDDDIRGGAGADTFVYESALESTSKHYDTISNANFAVGDRFDVFVAVVAIDAEIVTGKLWKGNFDADLSAAADTAHLGAGHAVLFTPDHGNLAGQTFLIVDQNGTAGYQAGEDLVINLLQPVNAGALGVEDFI